jgi:hypothetical protein
MSICILKNHPDHYEITTDSLCGASSLDSGSKIDTIEGVKNPKVYEISRDFYLVHAGSPMLADYCLTYCLKYYAEGELKKISRLKMSSLIMDFRLTAKDKLGTFWPVDTQLAFVSPYYMRVNFDLCVVSNVKDFEILGSGRQIGFGAMEMGATTTQAVEIACKYNYCSLPVFTVNINKKGM